MADGCPGNPRFPGEATPRRASLPHCSTVWSITLSNWKLMDGGEKLCFADVLQQFDSEIRGHETDLNGHRVRRSRHAPRPTEHVTGSQRVDRHVSRKFSTTVVTR